MINETKLMNTLLMQAADTSCLQQSSKHLFNQHNLESYETGVAQSVALIKRKMSALKQPFSGIFPHELKGKFDEIDLDSSLGDVSATLAEVEALYLNDAVYFHHPHYVAHLNCPIVVPAILAEVILSSVNSSLDTWDQSIGGSFIEQKLIDWTCERIGLGAHADGVFTSGGTQSNLMAMLLARDSYCAKTAHHNNQLQGLPSGFKRFRILSSQASHFSVQKSAAILGLGYDAIISVACDQHYRMDCNALQHELEHCKRNNLIPIAVVATAGTTDFGSIDPMPEIAAICRQHNIWMHVDAAYGGALLVSPKYRSWLDGISHADSVTIDYHKSFLQPVSCSAFFVKDKHDLAHLTFHADYLNPKSQSQEGTPNHVNKSIQTTRRFDALKLWMTLRTMGPDQIGSVFDYVIDLAAQAYHSLASDSQIAFAAAPQLSTLVFRYLPSPHIADDLLSDILVDAANVHIRKTIFRSGEAVIAATKVDGQQYLKFTLLNPATTLADLHFIVGLVKQHGDQFIAGQIEHTAQLKIAALA